MNNKDKYDIMRELREISYRIDGNNKINRNNNIFCIKKLDLFKLSLYIIILIIIILAFKLI